jgi:hypothetical protein
MKLGFAHPVRQGNGLYHHVAGKLAPQQLDKLRYWFEGNCPPRMVAHEMDITADVRPNIDCVLITPTKIFEKMHLDFAVPLKVSHLLPIQGDLREECAQRLYCLAVPDALAPSLYGHASPSG